MLNRKSPRLLTISLGTGLLLALTGACGGEGVRVEVAGAEAGGRREAIKTQPFASDPCAWVSSADVAKLVGPVREHWRVKSAGNPSRQDDGQACVYITGGSGEDLEGVAVQVIFEDATAYEAGAGMVLEAVGMRDPSASTDSASVERAGWDYTGGAGSEWVGRIGHMAVSVGVYSTRIPEEAIGQLAALVRDRVPDLPVAAEYGDPNASGGGPDPCALVTREEAEAVLGKLPIAPYRSKSSSPFADGNGEACSYYQGRHRVLTITPHWTDAKWLFGAGGGLTDAVNTKVGLQGEMADTLEGPWEQASADIGGTLNFLVGDRMIEMQYRTSGIDKAGALQLARPAVERLAKAP